MKIWLDTDLENLHQQESLEDTEESLQEKYQRHSKNNMEYIAIAKNIKITPRKVRLIAAGVKKYNLNAALSALTVMNKRAAGPIKKTLDSAVANAVNNFKVKKEDLSIKDIIIEESLSLKRFHFAGRGRTRPYKRRSSHIRVILTDGIKGDKKMVIAETKEEASKEVVAGSKTTKTAAKRGEIK